MHAEQLLRVGPLLDTVEARQACQRSEGFEAVLVRVLSVQSLSGFKVKASSLNGHGLRLGAGQVHLDARLHGIALHQPRTRIL
jgi:hypothetical protein